MSLSLILTNIDTSNQPFPTYYGGLEGNNNKRYALYIGSIQEKHNKLIKRKGIYVMITESKKNDKYIQLEKKDHPLIEKDSEIHFDSIFTEDLSTEILSNIQGIISIEKNIVVTHLLQFLGCYESNLSIEKKKEEKKQLSIVKSHENGDFIGENPILRLCSFSAKNSKDGDTWIITSPDSSCLSKENKVLCVIIDTKDVLKSIITCKREELKQIHKYAFKGFYKKFNDILSQIRDVLIFDLEVLFN